MHDVLAVLQTRLKDFTVQEVAATIMSFASAGAGAGAAMAEALRASRVMMLVSCIVIEWLVGLGW